MRKPGDDLVRDNLPQQPVSEFVTERDKGNDGDGRPETGARIEHRWCVLGRGA
jgi:hypothetical protein